MSLYQTTHSKMINKSCKFSGCYNVDVNLKTFFSQRWLYSQNRFHKGLRKQDKPQTI